MARKTNRAQEQEVELKLLRDRVKLLEAYEDSYVTANRKAKDSFDKSMRRWGELKLIRCAAEWWQKGERNPDTLVEEKERRLNHLLKLIGVREND